MEQRRLGYGPTKSEHLRKHWLQEFLQQYVTALIRLELRSYHAIVTKNLKLFSNF